MEEPVCITDGVAGPCGPLNRLADLSVEWAFGSPLDLAGEWQEFVAILALMLVISAGVIVGAVLGGKR